MCVWACLHSGGFSFLRRTVHIFGKLNFRVSNCFNFNWKLINNELPSFVIPLRNSIRLLCACGNQVKIVYFSIHPPSSPVPSQSNLYLDSCVHLHILGSHVFSFQSVHYNSTLTQFIFFFGPTICKRHCKQFNNYGLRTVVKNSPRRWWLIGSEIGLEKFGEPHENGWSMWRCDLSGNRSARHRPSRDQRE